jgi:hypothetical protein
MGATNLKWKTFSHCHVIGDIFAGKKINKLDTLKKTFIEQSYYERTYMVSRQMS